ncbi:MAG: hypothetical protein NTV63_03575 [Candidatus Woesearchaeota archaeon]|nr:hypothetical protein [Candidatus Woesearchaeota archaeon]
MSVLSTLWVKAEAGWFSIRYHEGFDEETFGKSRSSAFIDFGEAKVKEPRIPSPARKTPAFRIIFLLFLEVFASKKESFSTIVSSASIMANSHFPYLNLSIVITNQ